MEMLMTGVMKRGSIASSKKKPAKAPKSAPVKAVKAAAPAKLTEAKKPTKEIEKAKAALKRESGAIEKSAAPKAPEAVAEAPIKKSKRISIDINPNEAASALAQKWGALYKKAEQIDSKPYNMKSVFEERTAIVHKVLGWGYILANRNDRLEVLFKDGIKYLISNYNP